MEIEFASVICWLALRLQHVVALEFMHIRDNDWE